MVSESEIVTRLREFLRTSDLNTTTGATVRRKLEEDLGIDLSDKKAFVREQIDLFLESQAEAAEDKDEAQSEEEGPLEADNENENENAEEDEEESKASSLKGENDDEIDEQEEEEEEEEEVEAKISKGKKSSGTKRPKKQNKEVKKRGGGGFAKICSLSPELQKLIGVPEMARTEVVKQLWAYIRGNNLQDPSDRRNIICDEQLHAIFRVKVINMFQMSKSLAKHIWPLGSVQGEHDNDDKEAHQKEKLKEEDKEEEEGEEEVEEENSSKSKEEDDDEEGKEHEETSTRKRKAKKAPKTKNKEVKKSGGGFTMPCSLSPKLQSFTGVSEMARTQVVKYLWSYIKEKNLQDPSNKRNILCDETLHALFGVNSINMFQMSKALAKHIWPLERDDGAAAVSTTEVKKPKIEESKEDSEEPKRKKKRKKVGTPDSSVPLELSDALVDFLGTDESALSLADVEKRIWQYIKENDLQDPSDEKRIECDEKLKELFEVEFFEDTTLSKLITNHLTNT